MTQIEVIYQGGVFNPLHAVDFPENRLLRLQIEPIDAEYARAWRERVRKHQHEMPELYGGFFPDSTLDIAEDRMRDI